MTRHVWNARCGAGVASWDEHSEPYRNENAWPARLLHWHGEMVATHARSTESGLCLPGSHRKQSRHRRGSTEMARLRGSGQVVAQCTVHAVGNGRQPGRQTGRGCRQKGSEAQCLHLGKHPMVDIADRKAHKTHARICCLLEVCRQAVSLCACAEAELVVGHDVSHAMSGHLHTMAIRHRNSLDTSSASTGCHQTELFSNVQQKYSKTPAIRD